MTVKIGEREIEMHYSLRMYMLYENIVGESLDYTKLESYTTILNLFYCAVLSSMQYHKMELDLKFDEFIDWIDTEGKTAIPEFLEWYFGNLKLEQELQGKTSETTEKNKKKSDKKGKSLKNAK
jgi:hypothetical protein